MVKNKSQISIEYMILTGFVLLVIIVPSVFFLYSFANKGVGGTVQRQKTMDLGNGLVDNAKQMYYLGLYSKKNVEYDVPINVENMFIVEIIDTAPDPYEYYYYFGLIVKEEVDKEYYFQSDVALTSDTKPPYNTYIDTVDPGLLSLSTECSSYTCNFFNFNDPVIKEGKKTFKLETVMDGNFVKVAIVPIIE